MSRNIRHLALRAFAIGALVTLGAGAAQAAGNADGSGNAQAGKTITLIGQNDLRYSKANIAAAPGEKITLKLVNKSHLPASAMSHNWVLLKQGVDAKAFDRAAQSAAGNGYFPKAKAGQTIAHTAMVKGGQSDSVTFTAPKKPGKYLYICTFPGHYGAGMKGTLTVK